MRDIKGTSLVLACFVYLVFAALLAGRMHNAFFYGRPSVAHSFQSFVGYGNGIVLLLFAGLFVFQLLGIGEFAGRSILTPLPVVADLPVEELKITNFALLQSTRDTTLFVLSAHHLQGHMNGFVNLR